MKRTWLKYVKFLSVAVLTAGILNGCSMTVDGPVAEGSQAQVAEEQTAEEQTTKEQTTEAIEEHTAEATEETVAEATEEPTEESSEEFQETFVTVDLVAVGDNLILTGLYIFLKGNGRSAIAGIVNLQRIKQQQHIAGKQQHAFPDTGRYGTHGDHKLIK